MADYDCDGWPDLLVTGYGKLALFHNESDGHGGRKFAQLSAGEAHSFVDDLRQNKLPLGPGGFVYTVIRSDAIDVVYGTMDGYAAVGMPYMPHIAPTKKC